MISEKNTNSKEQVSPIFINLKVYVFVHIHIKKAIFAYEHIGKHFVNIHILTAFA